jgi:hypothetical protein
MASHTGVSSDFQGVHGSGKRGVIGRVTRKIKELVTIPELCGAALAGTAANF